ncbi:MAG: ribulose-phosphate 3-epimerase [Chloroflexota bacterium]
MPEQRFPYLISSSLLSADFTHLADQIAAVQAAGVDWLHVDVMDGHFVPNLTMGPFIVEHCRRASQLPLDVHLMVDRPDDLLEDFARAGASLLSVHVETCPNLYRTLQKIRELGCKPGVVLNPGTPASAVAAVLHLIDLVLVMSVNPGYSGQKFIPEVLPKAREIRRRLDDVNPTALIEMDGGLTAETLPLAIDAGVQVCVAAYAIFKHPQGIAAGVGALRACLPGAQEKARRPNL